MHTDRETGLKYYDTYEELLKAPIIFSTEYDGYYYVRVKPRSQYDELVWKVNKKTKELSAVHMVEYFQIEDKATPVKLT